MEDPLHKELALLQAEIAQFTGELHEVSIEMIKDGYTKYPVFIAHDGNVEMGETLFDAGEFNVPYFINVSMLEDFVEAGIIPEDKKELFFIAYGDPKQFMCIFFVVGGEARFVFYPYAKRSTDQ